MKEFNSLEEIQKYYNKETNTYNFIEDGELISIKLNFNLCVKSDINAWDINARDINAWDINASDINARDINASDINARDINAWDINASDITYYAICLAYKTFKCYSIKGRRENAKHICLDNKIIIKEEKN